MSCEITLVWIGAGEASPWPKGPTLRVEAHPFALDECIERELPRSRAVAWLFWDGGLGAPDPARIEEALSRPGDLWHAGLRLGMAGLPRAIDHVASTWMLNRDPDPSIEATSWRVSLNACLVRTEVLRRLGGVRPEFRTLAAAGLEFGHRCVRGGALTRHLGWLAGETARPAEAPEIPDEDELRFLYQRFGRVWTRWSVFRMAWSAPWRTPALLSALRRVTREDLPAAPFPLREGAAAPGGKRAAGTVTVLIPTVDRYPYLETLLDQLRGQTVKPLEIVIVDQTPPDRRRADLAERFADLPIRLFPLEQAGQCSSRNVGIEASRGDFVLFLDDDDEVPPDLIERHLTALEALRSEVSSGVAEEDGAGPLPEAFRRTRTSDVFPTNNSLIRKSILSGSGLFDLAYERGARADADLGMRLYLAGNLMVLNADIRVLHHHAPSGGLRTHGARVITYASSRTRLLHRHLPGATEMYLAKRYFSPRQVREALWQSALGTFSARGGRLRRAAKAGLALILLPHSLWSMRQRQKSGEAMLRKYPQIAAWSADRGNG
jgi:hypothetical protein